MPDISNSRSVNPQAPLELTCPSRTKLLANLSPKAADLFNRLGVEVQVTIVDPSSQKGGSAAQSSTKDYQIEREKVGGNPRLYKVFVTESCLQQLGTSPQLVTDLQKAVLGSEEHWDAYSDPQSAKLHIQKMLAEYKNPTSDQSDSALKLGFEVLFLGHDYPTVPGNLVKLFGIEQLGITALLNDRQRAFLGALTDPTEAMKYVLDIARPVVIRDGEKSILGLVPKGADLRATWCPHSSEVGNSIPHQFTSSASAIRMLLETSRALEGGLREQSTGYFSFHQSLPFAYPDIDNNSRPWPWLKANDMSGEGPVKLRLAKDGPTIEIAREDAFAIESWYGQTGDKKLRSALTPNSIDGRNDDRPESRVSSVARILQIDRTQGGATAYMGHDGMMAFHLPPGSSIELIVSSHNYYHAPNSDNGLVWGLRVTRPAKGEPQFERYQPNNHMIALPGTNNWHDTYLVEERR